MGKVYPHIALENDLVKFFNEEKEKLKTICNNATSSDLMQVYFEKSKRIKLPDNEVRNILRRRRGL